MHQQDVMDELSSVQRRENETFFALCNQAGVRHLSFQPSDTSPKRLHLLDGIALFAYNYFSSFTDWTQSRFQVSAEGKEERCLSFSGCRLVRVQVSLNVFHCFQSKIDSGVQMSASMTVNVWTFWKTGNNKEKKEFTCNVFKAAVNKSPV